MSKKLNKNDYEIKNQAGADTAELLLYGIIGDYWDDLDAGDIVRDLKRLDVGNIIVRIYSDGGSVFAGLAIYNALKTHAANITIVVDSLAASIASVIAMAGKVIMPSNAFMMIHNPSGGAFGEAGVMLKMAEILDKIKSSLVGVYTDKTGIDKNKVVDMMDAETWMTAKEALALGFCDSIQGQTDPQNFNDKFSNRIENFKNVPDQLKEMIQSNKPGTQSARKGAAKVEITLEKIKTENPDIAKALKDEGAAEVRGDVLKEGATAENERILSVSAQAMPGHEKMINDLMFDGETTGPQAAVKVLAAEKEIRNIAGNNLVADKIKPAAHAAADPAPIVKKELPATLENCKAEFEKSPEIQEEFEDYKSFHAYRVAMEKGSVKVRGK